MDLEELNIAVPAELAGRLRYWMAADRSETIDVLSDAVNRLEGLHLKPGHRTDAQMGQVLVERFRKYRGLIKDTPLCELLDARREGILE